MGRSGRQNCGKDTELTITDFLQNGIRFNESHIRIEFSLILICDSNLFFIIKLHLADIINSVLTLLNCFITSSSTS